MTTKQQSGWLRLFCPDWQCLREEERINLPMPVKRKRKDLWLKTFCPERQCEIITASTLP